MVKSIKALERSRYTSNAQLNAQLDAQLDAGEMGKMANAGRDRHTESATKKNSRCGLNDVGASGLRTDHASNNQAKDSDSYD